MSRAKAPAEHLEAVGSSALLATFGLVGIGAIGAALALALPGVALVGGGLLGIALLAAFRRIIFTWRFLLFAVAAVIMFVPARAYTLVGGLPFELEPYRLLWLIGAAAVFWAVFVRRSRPWRPIEFGLGIAAYLLSTLFSFALNAALLNEQGLASNSIGAVASFLVLLLPLVLVRQLLDSERLTRQLLVFLVWSGVVVAAFAVFEQLTHINVFRLYDRVLPLTRLVDELESTTTTGAYRAFGSAQHPIALAVALSLLLPIALWLSQYALWPRNLINRRIVYGLATMGLFGGILAALSRTPVVATAVMMVALLLVKPKLAGILMLIATPGLLLVSLLRPKAFETMFLSFLDPESLIASQYTSPGWAGQGRLADLGPAMQIVAQRPFFGTGLGSRIVVGDNANSFILDNQWLGNLMDLGMVGTVALVVFMVVPVVKLVRYAFTRAVEPRFADLALAIAVSTVGYMVSMYFFDAFSFIQSFYVLSLLWAAGAWLLSETPVRKRRPRPALSEAGV
jgi:polysaccharide biosynthesis protein PslJ